MSSRCIYQDINIRKWELILWIGFIKILKICIDPYLAIFLLY